MPFETLYMLPNPVHVFGKGHNISRLATQQIPARNIALTQAWGSAVTL